MSATWMTLLGICLADCSFSQEATNKGSNPQAVTFVRTSASAMQAIDAIALQAKTPLAIILGANRTLLCEEQKAFSIVNVPPTAAFQTAVQSAHYQVLERQNVTEIVASDLTSWQRQLLENKFLIYKFQPDTVLNELFFQLQGWLLVDAEGATGFGGSTLSSPSALRFTLPEVRNSTTEEIANQLINLDSKAIWIFKAGPVPTTPPSGDQFDIYSYRDDSSRIQNLTCP